jgi:hypothetical protein
VLDVIERFLGDTHDGRPFALRLAPPHPFPAPSLRITPPRRAGLVYNTRTSTEATTERYWPTPARPAATASMRTSMVASAFLSKRVAERP